MPGIDLSAYLADNTFTLHGIPSSKYQQNDEGTGGKSYVIPSLSGEDGVRLQFIIGSGNEAASAADVEEVAQAFLTDKDGKRITMREKLLGSALVEMLADGVENNTLQYIEGVITTQASSGTEMARRFVERISAGEAARPNRAARRAAKKQPSSPAKAGSRSNPTSGGSRTPQARTFTPARKTAAAKKQSAAKTA